jgi:hypothetical protein
MEYRREIPAPESCIESASFSAEVVVVLIKILKIICGGKRRNLFQSTPLAALHSPIAHDAEAGIEQAVSAWFQEPATSEASRRRKLHRHGARRF